MHLYVQCYQSSLSHSILGLVFEVGSFCELIVGGYASNRKGRTLILGSGDQHLPLETKMCTIANYLAVTITLETRRNLAKNLDTNNKSRQLILML